MDGVLTAQSDDDGNDDTVDPSDLHDNLSKCFLSAKYWARYDGIFIFDLELDFEELKKVIDEDLPSNEKNEQSDVWKSKRRIFVDEASASVAAEITKRLKHTHYFHEQFDNVQGIKVPLWTVLASLALMVGIIAALMWWRNGLPQTAELFMVLAAVSLLSLPTGMFFNYLLFRQPHIKLSTKDILKAAPVSIDSDQTALTGDFVKDPNYIANLESQSFNGPPRHRSALGQLRRHYLRNHEDVTFRIAQHKLDQQQTVWKKWHERLYMPAFVIALILLLVANVLPLIDREITTSPRIITMGIFSLILFWNLVYSILVIFIYDLPHLRLLRNASGFFAASEPLNDVISHVLKNAGKVDQLSPNISFKNVREVIDAQIAGEAQKLSNRQFWITLVSGLFAVIVAVIGITLAFSDQTKALGASAESSVETEAKAEPHVFSEDGDERETYFEMDCDVITDGDVAVRQICSGIERPQSTVLPIATD
ncbi:MAG TPA: hypothetical protein DDZ43_18580 [Hyphomonadaceae bacterium]|nr:hypothetical protein [Ponticaulis sp.]HBJ94887.1 hypothetical protein [Hyphomonadaceae bacterium]